MNDSEPLGLPRGTVRAALALMLTGTTVFLFAIGGDVPDGLLALTGPALTFYFIERSRENKEDQTDIA